MSAEPNLHELFRSATDSASPIDVKAVIRRSRRRRVPKQVGLGSAFTLAIAGVGIAGVTGLSQLGGSTGSTDSSAVDTASPQQDAAGGPAVAPLTEGSKRAPADKINLCGGSLAEVAPSASGLVLTADFPDAAVGAASVPGILTLTNTGTATVSSEALTPPAVTLSQNGTVLWHSNGQRLRDPLPIELAPGKSMTFDATIVPVVCGTEDDALPTFHGDLPAAPAGEYQLSAAMDVTSTAVSGGAAELVTGPTSTIRLR